MDRKITLKVWQLALGAFLLLTVTDIIKALVRAWLA